MPAPSGSTSSETDLYLRISQLRGDAAVLAAAGGDVAAHDRQEKDCRALAKRLGKKVRHIFVDVDSAYGPKRNRPGFNALLKAQSPCIITHHTDRSWREPADLELVIALDVDVYAVKAGHLDLSTPAGRAVARTLVAWAKYEMELKAERQRNANLQRAEAGEPWVSSGRAFGYTPDGLHLVETEADLIREAFADVLAGASLRAVTRRWKAEGVRTTHGNEWTGRSVRKVLQREAYTGRRIYRGVDVAPSLAPAIVDPDTFAAVQVVLGDPSRRTTENTGRGPLHLLAGIALCGHDDCDGRLHTGSAAGGTSRPGQSAQRPRYRTLKCSAGRHLERGAEPIEDYVTEVVLARLRRKDAAELFRATAPDLKPLRGRAKALRKQRETLAADLDVDLAFAKARDRRLREELEAIDEEIAAKSSQSALRAFASGREPGGVWAEMDIAGRREVVRELVEVVVLPIRRHGLQRAPLAETVRVTPRR